MIRTLRVVYRLIIFPTATIGTVLLTIAYKLFRVNEKRLSNVILSWARNMRFLMNVKVDVEGDIPDKAAVIVSNHRSYLDVIMIPCNNTFAFVAKASVKKWPLIGQGATNVSTIWVDRDDPDSRKNTRIAILDRLKDGKSIIIFPEGTTNIGPEVLPFKPGMFHAAAGNNIPAIPVALEYQKPGMAWVGDDTFLGHFFREFHTKTIRVKVKFGTAMTSDDGEELRLKAHEWITQETARMRKEWDDEREAKN
jgi:lyso-ornithine lipid O-acyltransferase